MEKIFRILYINKDGQVCEEFFTSKEQAELRMEHLEEVFGLSVLMAEEDVSTEGDTTQNVIGLSKQDILDHFELPEDKLSGFIEYLSREYSYSDMFDALDEYYELYKQI